MASNYVLERALQTQNSREISFAGDGVRLAGQMDYPSAPPDSSGTYPVIFILHHAGWHNREDYAHYARLALSCGFAVFRWDRRGTGRSGAGGYGSTTQDAVYAYETALDQPQIDPRRTVILAQSEASLMLGESYGLFARVQPPLGVILAGNMLPPSGITAIDTRVQVLVGENDWFDWHSYARDAVAAHNGTYNHGATFYVAQDANRMLLVDKNDNLALHFGAMKFIRDWLLDLCPPSQ